MIIYRKLRMIYLCPKHYYQNKMSRVRFHQIEAIAKQVDMTWTGPGWNGYDINDTVQANIDKKDADLIIYFDHLAVKDLAKTTVPRCIMMNEMHDPNGDRESALNIFRNSDPQIIICHHKNEMDDPYFDEFGGRMHNISHCADHSIFKDYGQPKTVDVLLCGSLSLEKYALRRRFIGIIDRLKTLGYKAAIHQHPGGRMSDAHTNRYLIEFAKDISSAKICLTCSSTLRCCFSKYVEIPMCRSLLAGDLPGERHEFFKSFMLVIDPTDTDDAIVGKIETYLKDEALLQAKTDKGYQESLQFTMDHYASRFLGVYCENCNIHMSGRRYRHA